MKSFTELLGCRFFSRQRMTQKRQTKGASAGIREVNPEGLKLTASAMSHFQVASLLGLIRKKRGSLITLCWTLALIVSGTHLTVRCLKQLVLASLAIQHSHSHISICSLLTAEEPIHTRTMWKVKQYVMATNVLCY